ncbi:zinc finger protein 260-like isoform X2 [Poeciliopsis prolifica]|uniref:zinc finger protein 260-like isoform X2 n=1 Tax=Poeciliopsis prolifica TaxID=188132 RepID=UPI00241450B5|nr:zinc finger protein 260-like isoform X2 [Poeciliopsis prolifica]
MVLHCQWGICTGDVRYRDRICGGKIHRFPKSEADCLAWIRACARPHEQLNLSRINKNKGVCAGHFVGGDGPTASHPYPTQAEGVHKARPARKRASERASRQDRIGAENLDTYDAAVSNDADKGIEVQTDEQWISPLDMLALTAELEMAKSEIIRLQAKVEHLETNLQKEKTAVRQEQKRKQFGSPECWRKERTMEEPPDDVQQVLVVKEELVVEEDDCSPREDQEDQKPPQIKEEEEENEITELTFNPVHVKNEDDKEMPPLSELLPSQTEGNRDSDDDKISNCSSETDVSDGNWEEREAQSSLDSVDNDGVPIGDRKCGKSKKLHICPDCGKTFRSRQGWLGHHRIHTGENPFSCSICNKTFSSKGNLQKHSKVHTGERPFRCSLCGTALKSKNALIEHTRIHTGEKPFSCSVCGRSFSFRSYLTVHMKCHSEEKPYSCSLCTAAFKRKNVLLAHVKTHTGEKPYSCSVCGKNFAHCVSLTCHMRSHTGERPYSCSVCKATFKWKNTFTHHIKIHTDD